MSLPVIGTAGENNQYVSYIFGNGVIRTGSQFPINIETERHPQPAGHHELLTYSQDRPHLGTSYGADMHPTNADLADKAPTGLWPYTSHDERASGHQRQRRRNRCLITLKMPCFAEGPSGPFFCLGRIRRLPLRSLGMCGLVKLMVYRNGVTDVCM